MVILYMITLIYITALFIICVPGFLFPQKLNCMNASLNGLLFTLILYSTYSLVNTGKEGLNNRYKIQVKGNNHLVDLIDKLTGKKETQEINIQTDLEALEEENKTE